MVRSTLLLNGQLIIDGVRFIWWVVDGKPAKITVSHAIHGTRTNVVEGQASPEALARKLARELLAERPH